MKDKLTPETVAQLSQTHPQWKLHEGKLVREWTFPDFIQAMAFVNRVAAIAEDAGHHPDIDVRYNRVLLALVSHDAGGLTQRDASIAAQLDREFPATA
jgi:4a-hydroxytetrahydrobiopterin dehydratase